MFTGSTHSSGLKLCWALIQYGRNLELPEEVIEHPAIKDISDTANDIVTFSNASLIQLTRLDNEIDRILSQDLYSYNIEQSKGDNHNFLAVLMKHCGMDLQSASNEVGEIVNARVDSFMKQRLNIPSWGPDIDKHVSAYIDGLAQWIPGSFAWSFETKRYFGSAVEEVRVTKIVNILPRARKA